MAGNSENLGSGASGTCSSSGGRQDRLPILPISAPIQVGPIHFETGSSSVICSSYENRTVSGGFGDLSSLITWRNNLPYLGGALEFQSGLGSFEIGTSSDLSLGGIRQNLLGSASFEVGLSSGPEISSTPQNQFGLSGSGFASFSGQFTGGTPRTYFQSNGSGIESSRGPYIGGSSLGLGASVVGPSNCPYGNSASVGLGVSGTRPNCLVASVGLESGSSLANWQDDIASDDWEIYYGSDGIRMGPSRVSQQNNVPIISDTSENHLGSRDIQLESSSVRRQNIHPRRGSTPQNRPGRVETGSSSPGRQITHLNRGRGTSGNSSWSGPVVSGSASEQPVRVADRFSGENRLNSMMAEVEDWTEEQIAIVEEALKLPSDLTKQSWFAWVSDRLHNKTARDVSIFLNFFMKERNAKRIKVDPNITTNNDRKENVPNSSPSSSHLTGSFGPPAQGTTVSNQEFPPQLTLQESTNAAPPQLRTDEELGNSVSSPTSDFDINLLLNLPYSPERIVEELSHLLPPPEPNPDEAKNHDGTSGHDNN